MGSAVAHGAGLSARLTNDNVKQAAAVLAFGSAHRPWTAGAIPNENLGLDLGLETTFLFRQDILNQGDGTAIIPRVIPMPRLWASWDLPSEFQASASFSPGMAFDGITTLGAGVQWVYFREEDMALAASVVGNYTYSNSFGDLTAHTFDVVAQVSRDLDIWQPYAGFGFIMGGAHVREALVLPSMSGKASSAALHFYLGARIDLMAKLSFQFDFTNFNPTFSGMMSTSF